MAARHTDWLAGLSPWPTDGFGLERMRALVAALGEPQRGLQAVHVVGTNGKSTTTRMVEALLLDDGIVAGAYLSPHIERWSERVRVGGVEADLESALAVVRPDAERLGATQFETLTAAAFVAFRDGGATAAAIEAGLGGRLDATNVLDRTVVVVLTNVGLEHTDVLGETREAIAREKLAVVRRGCTVVLGEPEWEALAREAGAAEVELAVGGDPLALAHVAVEAFLGHPVDPAPAAAVVLPGRLERRDGEIRDGAHNPDGVRWLVERLRPGRFVLCASMLADKDVDAMLDGLAELGDVLVVTTSSSPRALGAAELAERARGRFAHVEIEPEPLRALARAHALGEDVLVTGSLYLLADLAAAEGST
ncbi:MAG: bifunctional folylpolyglutamate synthase/dihydrofolate synthase [Gaiella sp.]